MCRTGCYCILAILVASSVQGVFAAEGDSLVAWWKLDEGSGEIAADSSGNGLDGTITDANWVAPGYDGTGACLEFYHAGYVDLGDPDVLNFGTGDWTVTAWVRNNITGTDDEEKGTVYANGGDWGGGIRYTLCVGELQDGQLTLTCDDDSTKVQVTGTTQVNDGEWHLVVGMREGTALRVGADGQLEGEAGVSASYNLSGTSQHNAYIGVITDHRDATLKKMYEGLIDDVRVFSRALKEGHLQDLYKGKTPNFYKASSPSPADGEMAAPATVPLFQWNAGLDGVLHQLYLGASPELTEADLAMPSMPALLYFHPAGLEAGQTYYWRVDEIQADGTVTEGDVWSFMTQALTAYYPTPVDGALDVSPAATLTWLPGYGAVDHQIYFSDVLTNVNEAAAGADKGIQEETAFTPGDLEGLTTYYWRVDEILAGNVVKPGPVWSFTTTQSVDDFESYVDDFEAGDAIWEVWVDGLTNGTGAIVGNFDPPFAETSIVHGGLQSMPVDYNNIDGPFYSETELPFDSAQDWTANGAGVLVLFVRGNSTNDAAPVYVALEDTSGNVHAVPHPDAALATSRQWVRWPIPFSEFADAGVNMARIKTLYIGVGNRDNPQPDGAGRVYVDDISLTKPE